MGNCKFRENSLPHAKKTSLILKRFPIFHPILFAIFPILYLYSYNAEQVPLNEIILPLSIILLLTILLWMLLSFVLKNSLKASLITSLFLLLFFSFGHFQTVISGIAVNNFVIGRDRFLILIWLLIFVIGFVLFLKIKNFKNLYNLNRILNIIAIFLLIFPLYIVSNKLFFHFHDNDFKKSAFQNSASETERVRRPNMVTTDSKVFLPDVYYIMLDSYASNSTLKEVFKYDNQKFTKYLSKKGFYIAEKSVSNYASTHLSLASSLNMEYLKSRRVGNDSDTSYLNKIIKNSKLRSYLKSKGYTFLQFGSWANLTIDNEETSGNMWLKLSDEFDMLLVKTTLLKPIAEVIFAPLLRERLLYQFDRLSEAPKMDAPTFVFAHILCPHEPFIFGPNGERVSFFQSSLGRLNPSSLYVNQVIFINKKVISLVDKILSESKIEPIIIIQADHGSGFILNPELGEATNVKLTTRFLKSQMRIFNAYYLPRNKRKYLYETITPVNSFRLILKLFFGKTYSLLEDKSFYSSHAQPFEFMEVTNKVKYD